MSSAELNGNAIWKPVLHCVEDGSFMSYWNTVSVGTGSVARPVLLRSCRLP
jgi:hypothetical protein